MTVSVLSVLAHNISLIPICARMHNTALSNGWQRDKHKSHGRTRSDLKTRQELCALLVRKSHVEAEIPSRSIPATSVNI